ncbi:packaged DNA stabilization gp4 family protein [Yersinia aldovae]|uniref:P22 tail accessory factor n=1 Tax=Yersinia aldovae TaxID=29483 RepID=A0ABM9STM4_YERAL|nr:packaged DNA stabilization gp4 family protein [Yersinia aldovae]CNL09681.1 P22 tail accessory factor [Yersinia aldovae]
MARTKGDLALKALRKSGLYSDATLTDADPQAISDSLYDLEDMMARWKVEGIDLGYLFSDTPSTDDDSGIPAWANDGVSLKLALQMCLDNVIPASDQLLAEADNAYQTICIALTTVPSLVRRNDMPSGTGNKTLFSWNRFYIEPSEPNN